MVEEEEKKIEQEEEISSCVKAYVITLSRPPPRLGGNDGYWVERRKTVGNISQ